VVNPRTVHSIAGSGNKNEIISQRQSIMKTPPICIDAYLSGESHHEIFNHNVSNFVRTGWDVFIISNKIHSFNQFHGVKYFEYDAVNRILPNRDRYILPSDMYQFGSFFANDGAKYEFHIKEPAHGFTNWTLFYNMRRMAETVKRLGHTHYIHCEYDINFTGYNLMETMYQDFGKTDLSLRGMVYPNNSGFGCRTNTYLLSVDLVLDTIPFMPTEDDYENFLIGLYGEPASPYFEKMFEDIFVKYVDGVATGVHLITDEQFTSAIDVASTITSDNDTGNARRSLVWYNNSLLCPVHNNTHFLVWNKNNRLLFVQYTTGNPSSTHLITVPANAWTVFPVSHMVEIITSDMTKTNSSVKYDLVNGWGGTGQLNPI
jgi:hypothetical protein